MQISKVYYQSRILVFLILLIFIVNSILYAQEQDEIKYDFSDYTPYTVDEFMDSYFSTFKECYDRDPNSISEGLQVVPMRVAEGRKPRVATIQLYSALVDGAVLEWAYLNSYDVAYAVYREGYNIVSEWGSTTAPSISFSPRFHYYQADKTMKEKFLEENKNQYERRLSGGSVSSKRMSNIKGVLSVESESLYVSSTRDSVMNEQRIKGPERDDPESVWVDFYANNANGYTGSISLINSKYGCWDGSIGEYDRTSTVSGSLEPVQNMLASVLGFCDVKIAEAQRLFYKRMGIEGEVGELNNNEGGDEIDIDFNNDENENAWSSDNDDNTIVEPPNLNPHDEEKFESGNNEINNSNEEETLKKIVCASAKPSFTEGSKFKRAKFTIGGTEPQRIKITSSTADNFAIKKEYGGLVYQVIKGTSWGSLTLEPGSYILSCNGGGALGLMSASVCIENPMVGKSPPSNLPPVNPRPDRDDDTTIEDTKPVLPKGPIERIFVRSADPDDGNSDYLTMLIKDEIKIAVWGEDTAGTPINVNVEEWKIDYDDTGEIIEGLYNPVPKDVRTKVKFKAGPNKGWVRVKVTVINKENRRISGVLPIQVVENPPITVTGCVQLYDENNKPVYSGGVKVVLRGSYYTSAEWVDYQTPDMFTGTSTDIREQKVMTDHNGRYKFKLAPHAEFAHIHNSIHNFPYATLGYKWMRKSISLPGPNGGNDDSIVSNFSGPIKDKDLISMLSKQWGCLSIWLEKIPFSIIGKVTYRMKPVKGAEVKIINNGKTLALGISNKYGEYGINVGNIQKGNYKLIADFKPVDYNKEWALDNMATLSNFLSIKDKITVDLPLQTQEKIINIELISWKDKIGYTGP